MLVCLMLSGYSFEFCSVSIWDLSNGKMLSTLDLSSLHARSIHGGAVYSAHFELDTIVFAFATCKCIWLKSP